ncbi:MAG TPA: hypothetical protein VGQ95_03530 [Chthoniobacterales bacterium]|nr:hypothetical protein [Chthoniobacterales bacterium]
MITSNRSTQTFDAAGQPSNVANFVWIVILTLAGVGGSVVISCVTPFVALAVALSGTVRLRVALRAMTAIWLTNQFIGFAFLHFPRTLNTFLWGFAIGAAAMLSTVVASIVVKCAESRTAVRLGLALLFGYAFYEIALLVAALFLGGVETFSPATIAQLGLVNLFWLVGLAVLNELVATLCKTWLGVTPRLLRAS